jgi:hypothetical protein
MPRTPEEIGRLLAAVQTDMRRTFMRRSLLNRKIQGRLTRTWMPKNADAEYKDLFRKASGPWLEFTRDAIAQGVRVDGCSVQQVWDQVWQANGMDGRQNGVTKEAIGLGQSYILVVPGVRIETVEDPETGEITSLQVADPDQVVMRPMSSLHTYASYADPWDEYPEWTISRLGPEKVGDFWNSKWLFIDDEALYRYEGQVEAPGTQMTVFEHELGYTPVAAVNNTLPAYGEPESSIERAIPVYERIVDATFTLEMVQRYGAFPQKYMSGGIIATNADGSSAVNISADSLIHSNDPDTKFGNFSAASLTDVASAKDSHIKDLAAVCQVPPHYLLGAVVNMSAEGIAAAESGYFRNIGERQDSISEGYELALRIACDILGIEEDVRDKLEVHFEDVSARSLSQVSDAITKLATLKLPLDRLFAMLPGFSQLDANAAAAAAVAGQKAQQKNELAIAQAATPPVPKELNEGTADTVAAPTPPPAL